MSLFGIFFYPWNVLGEFGVDSRKVFFSTFVSPADHSAQPVIAI